MPKFWIFKLWPAYLFCSCPTQISWTKKQLLFFPQACMVYMHLASTFGCNFTMKIYISPKVGNLDQKTPAMSKAQRGRPCQKGAWRIQKHHPQLGSLLEGVQLIHKTHKMFFLLNNFPNWWHICWYLCFLQVTLACLMSFLGQRCVNMIQ